MAADADPEVEVGERESVFPIDFEFKDIRLTVKLARPSTLLHSTFFLEMLSGRAGPWKQSPGKREILKGVSGIVRSGESLAILGPSGALACIYLIAMPAHCDQLRVFFALSASDTQCVGSGKTTLLDVLADRRKSSSFSGERLINGDANMAYVHAAALSASSDLGASQQLSPPRRLCASRGRTLPAPHGGGVLALLGAASTQIRHAR